MKSCISLFLKKYKYVWTLAYFPLYLAVFFWLENRAVHSYSVFQCALDTKIPFIEIFVIPYMLWFGFVAVTVAWFFFTDEKGYYRLIAFLYTGMTVFLIWSAVFPTRLYLRPLVLPRENIFTQLIEYLWAIDPPICVFPSIHVYNTLGVTIAIWSSEKLKEYKSIRICALVLAVLIILATVFIKQHSLLDVAGAFVLGYAVWWAVYQRGWERVFARKDRVLRRKLNKI